MAGKINKIVASTRMAAAIWAGNNKALIDNKPAAQIGQLVCAGINFPGVFAKSTVKDICKAAGITIKERGSPMAPLQQQARNGLRIRRLSVHLKNLYIKLGETPPADLVALCGGNAPPENDEAT